MLQQHTHGYIDLITVGDLIVVLKVSIDMFNETRIQTSKRVYRSVFFHPVESRLVRVHTGGRG